MALLSSGWLARTYHRCPDFIIGLVVVGGIIGLFIFDMSAPRGELDGVGYAALVALCVRFGDRAILACAALTTVLTLLASLVVPDAGISVAGMWANRGFAILEIWIIAAILRDRLGLEAYVVAREGKLEANQAALGLIVREAILTEKSQEQRLCFITEQAAETLGADFCAILRRYDPTGPTRIVNIWDQKRGRHFDAPHAPQVDVPGYWETMRREFVVFAEDVRTSHFHSPRLEFFNKLGVRAVLTAEAVNAPGLGWVSFWFADTHRWTDQECAFARALANLVALLFSGDRNVQTLAALDQAIEGIYVENTEGELLYANRAARDFSKGRNALTSSDFPSPDGPLTDRIDMHEISHQGRDLEIQRLRLPDAGILTRINDVTERNALLAERRRLEERLQRGAMMEAIGQLAGGIAHDFNNILASILGFAAFLKQDLPEKSAEHGFAERILSACARGKGLVEQIMAFARARAVERGVVDLGLMVKRNQDYLASLLPPQIALHVRLPDGALPVLGSAVPLDQLITNLFVNARDAFECGGEINITVRQAEADEVEQLRKGSDEPGERLWGDVQAGRTYGLLQVADQGTGISHEILDRIFEPFFTTKGRQCGTGLGLAVVHGVVESLDGIGHVRSILGSGTVFSIYLPLAGGTATDPLPPACESVNLRGREHILIVDDEADIADLLSIGLERLGYETVSVNDPQEALTAFMEAPETFDIVITDQVMLGLRGLELIRHLKETRPSIKAVLCSGNSDGVNEEIARQAGADAFFLKPVDSQQIAIGVRRLMDISN
jgi:signal transduction histidine kinase/CheY-like chemotaxis protein